MAPLDPKSTVLTAAEEATVVEFRRRTLLPLDDVLRWPRAPHASLLQSTPTTAQICEGLSQSLDEKRSHVTNQGQNRKTLARSHVYKTVQPEDGRSMGIIDRHLRKQHARLRPERSP